jgi:hypothetical protein
MIEGKSCRRVEGIHFRRCESLDCGGAVVEGRCEEGRKARWGKAQLGGKSELYIPV